eukprot:202396_1
MFQDTNWKWNDETVFKIENTSTEYPACVHIVICNITNFDEWPQYYNPNRTQLGPGPYVFYSYNNPADKGGSYLRVLQRWGAEVVDIDHHLECNVIVGMFRTDGIWAGLSSSTMCEPVGYENGRSAIYVQDLTNAAQYQTSRHLAHELGHNLGMPHVSGVERGVGHLMEGGQICSESIDYFSTLSMRKVKEWFVEGKLDCILPDNNCTDAINYNLCGNGEIDFDVGEECDNGECCDNDCKLIRGCCFGDEVYECVEVHGLTDDGYYRGGRSLDGYYGSCVNKTQANTCENIYVRDDGIDSKLYLKQTDGINVCNVNSDPLTQYFTNQPKCAWIIEDNVNFVRSNVYCLSNGNSMKLCDDWKHINCSSNYAQDLEGVIAQKIVNTSKCLILADDQCTYPRYPDTITVVGAIRDYLNGIYVNKDDSCVNGLPDYINDFKHLIWNNGHGQWQVTFVDAIHIIFARCVVSADPCECEWEINMSLNMTDWTEIRCIEHHEFEKSEQMSIDGIDLNNCETQNSTNYPTEYPTNYPMISSNDLTNEPMITLMVCLMLVLRM